jgi:microcompartment protein CcmK/EutM
MRAQSAWRDLVWAHLGRVDDVAEKVGRIFPGADGPGEILGISVIQSNKRSGGRQGSLFPVSFRLDANDGLCYMRFAYEDSPGKLKITEWEPIQRALCHISDLTPQKIGEETEVRRQHFEKFCKQVITDSCSTGTHPLVLINSTNSARLWSWLLDRAIDAANIDFKTEGTAMQAAWSGARIVRVRQENSPRLVIDKQHLVAHLDKSDKRGRKEIQPEASLRVTTAHRGDGALYKVVDSEFPVYLTVGGKDIDRRKRGASCYREVTLLGDKAEETEGKLNLYPLKLRGPETNKWSASKAIELVLAFIQEEDNPDAVAELVESLRFGYGHYGEWTSLPAPLFFERVVRDYVADFSENNDNSLDEDQEES